jgi:hypothetical protein
MAGRGIANPVTEILRIAMSFDRGVGRRGIGILALRLAKDTASAATRRDSTCAIGVANVDITGGLGAVVGRAAGPRPVHRRAVAGAPAQDHHAAVRCDADERQRLEQLCRYVTRPALANERVQINSAGQVVLKLRTA